MYIKKREQSTYKKYSQVAIQSCVIYIFPFIQELTIVKKMSYLPYYYFNGDASDPNVVAVIKTNFISLLKSPFFGSIFCRDDQEQCKEDGLMVVAGKLSST